MRLTLCLLSMMFSVRAGAGSFTPDRVGVRYDEASPAGTGTESPPDRSAARRPGLGLDAAEYGGGLLGGAVVGAGCGVAVGGIVFVAGKIVPTHDLEFKVVGIAALVAVPGYFCGTAWGVRAVGRRAGQKGSFGWAVAGSVLGAGAGAAVGAITHSLVRRGADVLYIGVGALALAPAGAVAGYSIRLAPPRPAVWLPIAFESGAGFVAGWLLGSALGISNNNSLGLAAGLSLGTTAGTWGAGLVCRQGGRILPTASGAVAGAVACAAAFKYSEDFYLMVTGALLPATGAVIGYNLSRPKPVTEGSFINRFELPGLSLERVRCDEGNACTAVDLRFVTVRF